MPEQDLKEGLGTSLMRFIDVPLRTRPARAVQRALSSEGKPSVTKIPESVSVGTSIRPFNEGQ